MLLACPISGSIKGIVARGGFVIDLNWDQGKITKLVIASRLGGDCRLRLPNALKARGQYSFAIAKGQNRNPLFFVNEIKPPVIIDSTKIKVSNLKPTNLYDLQTSSGMVYTFTAD